MSEKVETVHEKETIMLVCPKSKEDVAQTVMRETCSGITLQCSCCGKVHSHEIGEIRG